MFFLGLHEAVCVLPCNAAELEVFSAQLHLGGPQGVAFALMVPQVPDHAVHTRAHVAGAAVPHTCNIACDVIVATGITS